MGGGPATGTPGLGACETRGGALGRSFTCVPWGTLQAGVGERSSCLAASADHLVTAGGAAGPAVRRRRSFPAWTAGLSWFFAGWNSISASCTEPGK